MGSFRTDRYRVNEGKVEDKHEVKLHKTHQLITGSGDEDACFWEDQIVE